jgi:UDP-N-acetylglucosamine 2-epimerase
MIIGLERILISDKPDLVILYGDTNSTLAGAISASKLNIPIGHVEAGLRSFNMGMPEEQNRKVTDHLSSLLFCPSENSVQNLKREGITSGVFNVGDIMADSVRLFSSIKKNERDFFSKNTVSPKAVVTLHRAATVDDKPLLKSVLEALNYIASKAELIFPIHPRTRKAIDLFGLSYLLEPVVCVNPLSYSEMLSLVKVADVVLTDSGGLQKEAYFLNVPCITMRSETEWVETVSVGANRLVGTDAEEIVQAFLENDFSRNWPDLYGDSFAGEKIIETLLTTVL